ncbi:MAG: hypothetical protein Q8Q92_04970 [bacterium]|nr:hypothetical protein [bacterium]
MEEQSQNIKTISAVMILLILGVGFVLFGKYRNSNGNTNDKSAIVMVENTLMTGGVLLAPAGFPQEIPLEGGEILESATTQYPEQNTKQLSVSYQSSKTITQKYAEYRDYMTASGYQITKEGAGSPAKIIFGTKNNADLSVVVSSSEGGTLVQLSYLLKSIVE